MNDRPTNDAQGSIPSVSGLMVFSLLADVLAPIMAQARGVIEDAGSNLNGYIGSSRKSERLRWAVRTYLGLMDVHENLAEAVDFPVRFTRKSFTPAEMAALTAASKEDNAPANQLPPPSELPCMCPITEPKEDDVANDKK